MLPLANRLKKVRDFNLLLKHGRWVNGDFIDLKYLELAKADNFFPKKVDVESFKKQLRIAFSAGLKLAKSAVKRNRIRRKVREAVRLLLKEECLQSGYLVLLKIKPAALEKDYAAISQEIELLFKKAGILINK